MNQIKSYFKQYPNKTLKDFLEHFVHLEEVVTFFNNGVRDPIRNIVSNLYSCDNRVELLMGFLVLMKNLLKNYQV